MRTGRWVAATVLAVGVAAAIDAQPPRQPGGGFGGFGGRVQVSAAVLNNTALQDELKITADQKEKLKGVAEKQAAVQKKMTAAGGGFGGKGGGKGAGKGGDREKMAEVFKENEAVQAEVKKALDEVLTADQKKRVRQIEVQAMGVRAMSDEEVVKGLGLTDGQKEKVKAITEEYTKSSRELGGGRGGAGGGGRPDPAQQAENQKKRDALTATTMTKIAEALTDEQKKTWKGMIGEPFDLAKLRPVVRKID